MAEATDKSETEEFLKCPICLEFYVDPKFLPCLHTFCRPCLQTYITSTVKGGISETKPKVEFPCPICRTMVTDPCAEGIGIEELASQFPNHQTMSSLLDKHNLEANVKYCDPCLAEKSENQAKTWCKVCCEAFCDECTKWHRKMTLLKSHKLVQLSDMDTNELDIIRLEFCDVHKDEVLKAFCKDHDKACCVTCVTIEHRKCDDVTTLDEAAKDIKETPETKMFLKRLRDSENALSEMLRIRKQNVSGLESQKETMLAELAIFRKRIDEHFNVLEVKLKDDIASKQIKPLLEENDYILDLESKYATILNYRKLLETCLQKASDVHTLLEMKRLINKTRVFGKELKPCAVGMKEINLEMRFDAEIEKMLSTFSLGTVEVHAKSSEISLDFLHNKFFSYSGAKEISTFQLPKEIQSAMFKNGDIILTTEYHIHFCDEKGEKMTETEVEGASSICGVAVLRENAILLSRSSWDRIYTVDIITKKLREWKTKFECYNIVNTGNQIIAARTKNIAVLDFQGRTHNTISIRGNKVRHIAYHGGSIYYTISDEHAVRAVSLNGEHGFEYKNSDLKDPRGIDTDTKGIIYVAGYASSNVHQISKGGQLLNIILTDIVKPNVLCVSKTGDRLLVSHSNKKVNVYELY